MGSGIIRSTFQAGAIAVERHLAAGAFNNHSYPLSTIVAQWAGIAVAENAFGQTIFIIDSTVSYGPVIIATLVWIEDAYDQTVPCDQRLNACDVISKLDAFTAIISLLILAIIYNLHEVGLFEVKPFGKVLEVVALRGVQRRVGSAHFHQTLRMGAKHMAHSSRRSHAMSS